MVGVLAGLGLSRLAEIPGLTAVGAAAVLAETGCLSALPVTGWRLAALCLSLADVDRREVAGRLVFIDRSRRREVPVVTEC